MKSEFQHRFERGQEGLELGLSTGFKILDDAFYGWNRSSIVTIASAPKVGKTTFCDAIALVYPYLDALEKGVTFTVDYFSYEIDRITKMFRLAPLFFEIDHDEYIHEVDGEQRMICDQYLRGRLRDKDDNLVKVSEKHKKILEIVYQTRLRPLFGVRDIATGKTVEKGIIRFHKRAMSSIEMQNVCYESAHLLGDFYIDGKHYDRIDHDHDYVYRPKEENAVHQVIIDHVRKIKKGQYENNKATIDGWSSIEVDLRDRLGFSFVNICHTNRNDTDSNALRYRRKYLHPTNEDLKDTGNLGEDCNYLITLLNPYDLKYDITDHFGIDLTGSNSPIPEGKRKYYRTVHLVYARDAPSPKHMAMYINGANGGMREFGVLHNDVIDTSTIGKLIKPKNKKIGSMDAILRKYSNMAPKPQLKDVVIDSQSDHPLDQIGPNGETRRPIVPIKDYTVYEIEEIRKDNRYYNPPFDEEPVGETPEGCKVYNIDLSRHAGRYQVELNGNTTTYHFKPLHIPDNYEFNAQWRNGKRGKWVLTNNETRLPDNGGLATTNNNGEVIFEENNTTKNDLF